MIYYYMVLSLGGMFMNLQYVKVLNKLLLDIRRNQKKIPVDIKLATNQLDDYIIMLNKYYRKKNGIY